MLFPNLIIDSIVAENDMFRFDASKSFHSSGEVLTNVNIYPDVVNNIAEVYDVFVENCPEDYALDYAYETAGDYTVRVELISSTGSKFKDYTIKVVDEATDNLQATDAMLYAYESELKNYIPKGRNSYKYIHRIVVEEIIDYLYRRGIYNADGTKIEKSQLIGDKLEKWATFEALVMIFQDIKVSNVDLFNEKIADYSELRNDARKIYCIRYDNNKDGQVDKEDAPIATRNVWFSR